MRLLSLSFVLVAACGSSTNAPAPSAPPAPAPAPIASAPPAVEAPAPIADAGPPKKDGPFASLPPSLPTDLTSSTKPAPVKREGKAWPFHKWDRAEAVVFNWEQYGSDSVTVYRVYDDRGWSSKLVYRAPLDLARAKQSVDLVLEAKGELEVSKCAFPRHGVVLYDGDTVVGSINVCLSCHDIMLWPRTPPAPNADKRAELVLPRWEKLFAGELNFPLWPKGEP